MRERTQAALFLVAWLLTIGLASAGLSAVLPAPPSDTPGGVTARLLIEGPSWTIEYEATTASATVFAWLLDGSASLGFSLDWVEYGWPYHDVLVTSINGTRSDGAAGLHWQYCVNGAYATQGARHQPVRDGDLVLWAYAPPGGDALCR